MIFDSNSDNGSQMEAKASSGLVLLLASVVVLLPFKRIAELPMLIMALAGFWLWFRHGLAWAFNGRNRYLTSMFLLFWVPMWVSAIDSVNLGETFRVIASYLRFFGMGLFVIWLLSNDENRRKLHWILSAMLLVWLFDGVFQYVMGYNMLGYEAVATGINSFYGEDEKYGFVLAFLSPILLWQLKDKPVLLQALAWMLLVLVVFATGRRGAWILVFVVMAGFWLVLLKTDWRRYYQWLLGFSLLSIVAMATVYTNSATVQARVDNTLLAFNLDYESIDEASSHRLPIWETATHMISDHPINGVGTRGFRYAYEDYASENDPYLNKVFGGKFIIPSNTHHWVLEVLAETGVIGMAAIILALWYLSIGNLMKFGLGPQTPYVLALIGGFFPLNSHHSVYSAFWSQIVFIVIVLLIANSYRNKSTT